MRNFLLFRSKYSAASTEYVTGVDSGRDATFDVARGIGMLLVIYGHALEVLFIDRPDHDFIGWAFLQYKAIYSFHMPLFFLLSGAVQPFIEKKTFKQISLRSLSLLLIAFFVHIIGVIFIYFDRVEQLNDWQILKWSVRAIITGFGFSIPVLWFIVTLAIVQFLFWTMVSLKSVSIYLTLTIVAIASVLLSFNQDLPNYFQIKIWVPALVFFGLGWCFRRFLIALPILALVSCAAGVVLLFQINRGCAFSISESCPIAHLDGNFAVHMIQGSIGNFSLFYVTALLGSLAAIGIASFVRFYPLIWIGRNSLEIFIANGFILEFLNPFLKSISISESVIYPIAIIILVLIANVIIIATLRRPIQLIARTAKISAGAITRSHQYQ